MDSLVARLRAAIDAASPEPPATKTPRLAPADSEGEEEEVRRLGRVMAALGQDYPGDVGVVMPVLLNYLELAPGARARAYPPAPLFSFHLLL